MLSFDCTTMRWLAANPARLRPLSLAFILLPLAIGMSAQPAAAQYSYTTVSKVSGTYFAQVTGVNDAGTVVGYYGDSSGIHGFIWTGGNNFTTFDFPGAVNGTYPAGINNSGVIAGTWYGADFYFGHGFVGVPGNFASFDPPGAGHDCAATFTTGINNLGVIVGNVWDANCVGHGFIDYQGAFTSLDFPGAVQTFPTGINDSGQMVGNYLVLGGGGGNFLDSGGQFSVLTLPDGSNFKVYGIDNSGGLLGERIIYDSSGAFLYFQALLLANGKVTPIYPPGSPYSVAYGISSSGNQIVGYGSQGPFLASAYSLLDPVPDLMNGPKVFDSSEAGLGTWGLFGLPVQAVAADGVTEAVIRIPAAQVGDQISITLYNDQGQISSSPAQDGGLGNPGDTTFTQSQITVSAIAVSGSQQPFGFAVYKAPVDFARQNGDSSYMSGSCSGGSPKPDDQLACRTVSLQIQGSGSGTLPITILRPPVVMIHGLWSNWETWNNFNPLVTGPNHVDPLFSIGRISYDWNVGPSIQLSDPSYPPSVLRNASANSLGSSYIAQFMLPQVAKWIASFKHGINPLGATAAAVQADIVAHSMGGDVARALVLAPGFLGNPTFGQGYIHKLITIGTPHLGSPLASALLSDEGCVRNKLAEHGMFAFNTVSLQEDRLRDGAMGDLSPGSPDLNNLATQSPRPLPTALIAGIDPNFGGVAPAIALRCYAEDSLARQINSGTGSLFGGAVNDAIVSLASQLNNLSPSQGSVFTGVVHTTGAIGFWGLGYLPPAELDYDSGISSQVIKLLNTPLTNTAQFYLLNP